MSKLVDEVLEFVLQQVQLYRTTDQEAYVTYGSAWGGELDSVRSRKFRRWLVHWVHKTFGKVLSDADCKQIGNVLESRAFNDTSVPVVKMFTRVGWHEPSQSLYVDLADDARQVMRIRAGADAVAMSRADAPVAFYQGDKAKPLPLPQPPTDGATLDILLARVLPPSITAHQRVLMTAWLLGALHPAGPYPILVVSGQPGSAKSSICRLLRRVIDPTTPELLAEVLDTRNLAVAAKHNYCLAFDNVSHLTKGQSDRLCRLATGGGIAQRSLYTDEDLHALDIKRPVLLNSIGDVVTEGDLVNRSIQLHLPRLADADRKPETELWTRFKEHLPAILWHLYRVVGAALGEMGNPTLATRTFPRMQDFARFVTGAEAALGWEPGTFMAAYEENIQEAMSQAVTASFPVQALIYWMQRRERARRLTGAEVAWHGTAVELQRELEAAVANHAKFSREVHWPKQPNVLCRQLHTSAPALRTLGLDLTVRTETKARLHVTYVTPIGTPWQTFKTFAGPALTEERATADSGTAA